MKNPFLSFCRRMALNRNRSRVPTSLLPMTQVRGAAVFVDADDAALCGEIRRFFDDKGIPVRILCPQKRDVNWMGYMKSRVRTAGGPREEDFFISLAASPENFAAEYEARCSTARFKAGRFRLPGDVFDLIVELPAETADDPAAVFAAMKDYLNKIR